MGPPGPWSPSRQLGEDHTRALRLWDGLRERGWAVEDRPASNMVYVRVPDAPGWVATLETPDRWKS